MSVNLVSTTDTPEQVQAALGKLQPEQTETVENSAPEETQGEILEASEAQTEEKPDGESDDSKAEKPKKSGIQKRVGKLAARATRAEERAFQAEKEAQYWREQAMKSPPAEKAPEKVAQTQTGAPDPKDFDTHEEFVRATARYEAKQELESERKAAQERELQTSRQQREQTYFKEREEFAKTKEDFADVMSAAQGINLSLTVYESVLDAGKEGPALFYEMAKDPEALKRICSLPPVQAAREIGKIEARLSKSPAPQAEVKTTKAPKPIKPVGTTSADLSTKAPHEMTFQEYKAWREKNPNG